MRTVLGGMVKPRLSLIWDVLNLEKALVIKHMDWKVVVDLLNGTQGRHS